MRFFTTTTTVAAKLMPANDSSRGCCVRIYLISLSGLAAPLLSSSSSFAGKCKRRRGRNGCTTSHHQQTRLRRRVKSSSLFCSFGVAPSGLEIINNNFTPGSRIPGFELQRNRMRGRRENRKISVFDLHFHSQSQPPRFALWGPCCYFYILGDGCSKKA